MVHYWKRQAKFVAAVHKPENSASQFLRLPRLAGPGVIVGSLLVRLIALHILANHSGAVTADTFGVVWSTEELIQFCREFIAPPQQLDQALNIVGNKPQCRPARGFLHHEIVIRFTRIEW